MPLIPPPYCILVYTSLYLVEKREKTVEEEKETYSIPEAADYLGRHRGDTKPLYAAIHSGELVASKAGNKWEINGKSLVKYKAKMNGRAEVIVEEKHFKPVIPPMQEKRMDDSQLLSKVVSSVFAFLGEHHLSMSMQSLQEVIEQLRLWEVRTPECALQVVATGNTVTVLADDYQRQLEEKVQSLSSRLREAETKLAYLRQKPQGKVLMEYAHPLPVLIEARTEGFLVWCEPVKVGEVIVVFPFAAKGKTEEEALAAFRRTLHGYCWWLRTHEKELVNGMKDQFVALRGLLMEEQEK
jgi:hypothetical protein